MKAGRVKQIEDPFVINLEEGAKYGYVLSLLFLRLSYLLKQICNGSLRNTYVLTFLVNYRTLSNPLGGFRVLVGDIIVSLHGEGLS